MVTGSFSLKIKGEVGYDIHKAFKLMFMYIVSIFVALDEYVQQLFILDFIFLLL